MPRTAVRLLVVGPDGSGKSTLASALTADLRDAGLRVRHLHFDPLTPVLDGLSTPQSQHTQPHAQNARGALQYAAILRRLLRYWRAGLPGSYLSRRGADVIVQERGWLDQAVDPVRYRLSTSSGRTINALEPMTPTIDLLILLSGDAAKIASRKREITTFETDRQNEVLADRARTFGRVLELNTVANPPERVLCGSKDAVTDARAAMLETKLSTVAFTPKRMQMMATPNAKNGCRALYSPLSLSGRARRLLMFRSPLGDVTSPVRSKVAQALAEMAIPFDAVGVIQSSGRNRAVVAITRAGNLAEYVKLAWDHDNGLFDEARVLQELGPVPGVRIPPVLDYKETDGLSILRLGALQSERARLKPDYDQALSIAIALRWARDGKGVVHGDFAPWNVLHGNAPGLVDWEHSSLNFKPGVDLLHYYEAQLRANRGGRSARRHLAHLPKQLIRYAEACEIPVEHMPPSLDRESK